MPLKKALKVGSVSGNLHNEYLGIDADVALYKAVEVQNQHTGNFIAYKGEDEEVRLEVRGSFLHNYLVCNSYLI